MTALPPTRFDPRASLAIADAILREPPTRGHIERPTLRGEVVARFALPLALLQPQNRTRHGAGWALGKLKRDVFSAMAAQHRPRREPLPGRPQVLCVRFSSVEPDAYADWAKHAVDVLCAPLPALTREGKPRRHGTRHRLGLIRDDKPSSAEVRCWWEPLARTMGRGFGVIEVRTGETT